MNLKLITARLRRIGNEVLMASVWLLTCNSHAQIPQANAKPVFSETTLWQRGSDKPEPGRRKNLTGRESYFSRSRQLLGYGCFARWFGAGAVRQGGSPLRIGGPF